MTLREYYVGFRRVYLLGAGSGFLLPLVHLVLGDYNRTASYLYPPLGDMDTMGSVFTLVLFVLTTYGVLSGLESFSAFRRWFVLLVGLPLIVGIMGLFFLYIHFVRVANLTSVDMRVPVSIGYEKTPLGVEKCKGISDAELAAKVGAQEDKIQLLWTINSLFIVRAGLWFFYTLTLCCFVSFVSRAAYRDVSEYPPQRTRSILN